MLTLDEFNELVTKEQQGNITAEELKQLEPYQTKRAIFIAAGFGSRMVPITINTPKPLVRVKGVRIIDTLLDAVCAAGIEEIVIVRGYLKEQFDQLLYKYPQIRFIDNDMYTEANNISSVLLAKDYLENAYVLEADLLVSNPDIITKYHYTSDFLGIPVEHTDDWAFETKDGVITKQMKDGGDNCHQMVGISYWNKEDACKLKKHIEMAYNSEGDHQLYWEQVPLREFGNDYQVAIRECSADSIVEIDTFDELKAIDDIYAGQK